MRNIYFRAFPKNYGFFMSGLTVAVIGAGPSGLVTAKEAKHYGLKPTVFEQGNAIGGLWKKDGGTWESMRINNSRQASSFSDYEWKKESKDFPYKNEVLEYLQSYTTASDIQSDIRLNCKVTKVEKVDFRWRVSWINENQEQSASFDYLVVCSGVLSKAFIPEIPGLDTFQGSVIHAQSYKESEAFKGKNVVVIGNTFSGCEIASDLVSKAKKITHLFRRATWILSRYLKEKKLDRILPYDLTFNRANADSLKDLTPSSLNERINQTLQEHCKRQIEVCPDFAISEPLSNPPYVAITDTYLSDVKEGKIIPKKDVIKEIKENTLVLSDDTKIEADSIIFCTGYRTEVPFFSDAMKETLGFDSDDPNQPFLLYKATFHPEFSNLAFVGLARFGNFFGLVELQARLACMTFSGRIPLPTKCIMDEGMKEEQKIRDMYPKPQFYRRILSFSDELAEMMGVLPNFTRLREENPELYEKLWNGPFTTASFRLIGSGSNPEAAQKAINELCERVGQPFLDSEYVYDPKNGSSR